MGGKVDYDIWRQKSTWSKRHVMQKRKRQINKHINEITVKDTRNNRMDKLEMKSSEKI